jgi:hypothetical protein
MNAVDTAEMQTIIETPLDDRTPAMSKRLIELEKQLPELDLSALNKAQDLVIAKETKGEMSEAVGSTKATSAMSQKLIDAVGSAIACKDIKVTANVVGYYDTYKQKVSSDEFIKGRGYIIDSMLHNDKPVPLGKLYVFVDKSGILGKMDSKISFVGQFNDKHELGNWHGVWLKPTV